MNEKEKIKEYVDILFQSYQRTINNQESLTLQDTQYHFYNGSASAILGTINDLCNMFELENPFGY